MKASPKNSFSLRATCEVTRSSRSDDSRLGCTSSSSRRSSGRTISTRLPSLICADNFVVGFFFVIHRSVASSCNVSQVPASAWQPETERPPNTDPSLVPRQQWRHDRPMTIACTGSNSTAHPTRNDRALPFHCKNKLRPRQANESTENSLPPPGYVEPPATPRSVGQSTKIDQVKIEKIQFVTVCHCRPSQQGPTKWRPRQQRIDSESNKTGRVEWGE